MLSIAGVLPATSVYVVPESATMPSLKYKVMVSKPPSGSASGGRCAVLTILIKVSIVCSTAILVQETRHWIIFLSTKGDCQVLCIRPERSRLLRIRNVRVG